MGMTRERIEDIREVVLPFVSGTLLKTNYENLGKSDAEEFTRDFNEILNLAIKALEQEPTTKNNLGVDANCNDCLFKKEWEKIGKLLSVVLEKQTEQEPRKGHWIEHERNGIAHIECSECSSWFLRSHLIRNSYCPNCGAKMIEPRESEVEDGNDD